jgi:hypothetical protein
MFETLHTENQVHEREPLPLTSIEKGKIEHEAVHAAAIKGGAITIHGREMQPKTAVEEPRRSQIVEGLLREISEEVTRRAQVLGYRERGFTKHEIIKAVWKVEEGPFYEEACAKYDEIVGSLVKRT